jgi:hypothetical protein
MRATWPLERQLFSGFATPRLLLETEAPIRRRSEAAQAWEWSRLSLAQLGEDLMHHSIQLVRGFGMGDTRLLGQPLCDFRFPHSDFMLPARYPGRASKLLPAAGQDIVNTDLNLRLPECDRT